MGCPTTRFTRPFTDRASRTWRRWLPSETFGARCSVATDLVITFVSSTGRDHVTRFRCHGLEVEFRETRKQLETVRDELASVNRALRSAATGVGAWYASLSPAARQELDDRFTVFLENKRTLPPDELLAIQRTDSCQFLDARHIRVSDVKATLAEAGFYRGSIDDEFSAELAAAVEQFQRARGLRHPDGIVGPFTVRALAGES